MEEDYMCWLLHHKKAQGHEKRFMSRLGVNMPSKLA